MKMIAKLVVSASLNLGAIVTQATVMDTSHPVQTMSSTMPASAKIYLLGRLL